MAGAQTARASLSGATGSPVSFNLSATVGPATAFTATAGNNQAVSVSTPFATPLGARIADQYGNGIAGITVNWAVQSGSVTVGTPSSVTNAQGVASMTVTAGAGTGAAVVRATNASVAGNLDFALTVLAAPVEVGFGNTFFQSVHNGTSNPAVDTTQVGRPVRWTSSGGNHTVRSTGSPSFASSGSLSGSGSTYTVTFPAAGTYQYNCAVHDDLMTGRIVVQP